MAILALLAASPATAQSPSVQVVSGVGRDGTASDRWLALLRPRLAPAEYDSVAALHPGLTAADSAWARLIESRQGAWTDELPALAAPFDPARPPARAFVVLGNRGGSDAFTDDSITIGFDLSQLQASYGSATAPPNADLIDRLFRHEYIHLMQKSWLGLHPWPVGSPLEQALLEIWAEGQGNYYSLSERWRGQAGRRSEAGRHALATLEPRFVARLSALACARRDRAPALLRGLSSGPFDQKWGALPIALWLEEERPASADVFRRFVVAGPAGVWDFAARHVAEPLRPALEEARRLASACEAAGR